MRLLYVTSSLPYGWGEAFIAPEVLALRAAGHEVFVAPMRPRGPALHADAAPLADARFKTGLFSPRVWGGALRTELRTPLALPRTLRLIGRSRRIGHLAKNAAVSAKALWLADVVRDLAVDHIHAHWATTTATMALMAAESAGVPWSVTAHRWDIVEQNLFQHKVDRAAFVRFISQSGVAAARARGVRLDDRDVVVLPMGVELPDPTRAAPAGNGERAVVLCPGSFRPVKGHGHLLDAWAILRDQGARVELVLAGDGPLRSELEARVRERRLDDLVRFAGALPHDELLRRYREASPLAIVLPSLDLGAGLHEGIPVSLMEAMAHAIPVVATRTGGVPELVTEGTGILVGPGDARALAGAVAALAADESLRTRLAQAGRRRVEEAFDVRVIADRLAALFARGPGSPA